MFLLSLVIVLISLVESLIKISLVLGGASPSFTASISIITYSLQFDLSGNRGKSNRLYFTPQKQKQFTNSIEKLYNSAIQGPLGADYRSYVMNYLGNRLKKQTLFNNYINKVIIITDGYLDPGGSKLTYTPISKYQSEFHDAITI